jgi:glycosyltransferase involved in cell wall biosynthesis
MGRPRLASIIIDNYNFGRFLPDAIDSALSQTYPHTEVIVVDDGSSDDSREIIARYEDRITPVFKDNGGQDSAFNAGFALSRGDVVCFLDSDDWLALTALERALPCFDDPEVVKTHWPLQIADAQGRPTGRIIPDSPLPEGDLRDLVIRCGPYSYITPPTSGHAWARRFLEEVFPIREGAVPSGTGEAYLSMLAPLFGRIRRLSEPQAFYRIHGQNNYVGKVVEKLPLVLRDYEHDARVLSRLLVERGIVADPDAWRRNSMFHRLHDSIEEILALVRVGDTFVLLDGEQLALPEILAGRRRLPFLERDGVYWGLPPDDETAIRELERLRHAGAGHLVVTWVAFWWLEYYAGFHRHLRASYPCVLEHDRLVVFALGSGPPANQRLTSGDR